MVPAPVAVGMRPLTPVEQGHLERLRGFLAGAGIDVTDAVAVGALLDAQRARWAKAGGGDDPEGMLAALGVGIGELVLAAAPSAHWVLRTAIDRPAPALLAADGTTAVVPLDDVRIRWESGVRGWVPDYVHAAAAHLTETGGDSAETAAAVSSADSAVTAGAPGSTTPAATGSTISATPPAPAAAHASRATTGRRAMRVPRPRIPADLPSPPSTEVQILALSTLDRALELACASAAPAAIAVVAFRPDEDVTPATDLAAAQRLVAASNEPRVAVGWVAALDEHGYVVEVGTGTPAVLVEAGDAGAATLVVGHRFDASPVGDVVIVGQGAPLL